MTAPRLIIDCNKIHQNALTLVQRLAERGVAVTAVTKAALGSVEIAGQWTHEDQLQIAHALDLPADRVRIIYPAIGGAFGGREDMSLQIVLALASLRLAELGETRPIRSQWSREESIVGHHKRHRGRIHARWGAKSDGTLVAI